MSIMGRSTFRVDFRLRTCVIPITFFLCYACQNSRQEVQRSP